MSLAAQIIRLLDRPGGRWLLAQVLTRYARRLTGRAVDIAFDGVWMHAVDGRWFADRETFDVYEPQIRAWPRRAEHLDACARDYWFHTYQPTPGDIIVDVGAGHGTDLLAFADAVGPTGRVIAIEAHPATFRRLERACRWNRLTHVLPIEAAVLDRNGTVTIEDSDDDGGNSIVTGDGALTVAGCTLDDLLSPLDLPHIDFLKMNIEGAERLAVRGMRKTLARTRNLCIACHDFRAGDHPAMATRDEVTAALRAAGFHVERRADDPRPYVRDHLHATRMPVTRQAPEAIVSPANRMTAPADAPTSPMSRPTTARSVRD